MSVADMGEAAVPLADPKGELIFRTPGAVRVNHWINVLCVLVLLTSGMTIFNAHPRLYWAKAGADFDQPFFQIGARQSKAKDGHYEGYVRLGAASVVTTGVLGLSEVRGAPTGIAFPEWLTLPRTYNLALARRWHFFFAWVLVFNGLAYWAFNLVTGRARRELTPGPAELKPGHIWQDIVDHARLRFHRGEAARRYNTLQKLAYLGVAAVLLPLMVLTGLCMSPGFDSLAPWLPALFGGRQAARAVHFFCASGVVAFVFVHLAMVVLSGPINNLRSMITGSYRLPPERPQ